MAIGIVGNDKNNRLINEERKNKYFDENIYKEISLENTNESRSIICSNIKPNTIVLDVGCAQGAIGKFLREEKNCKVYGIELDEESIQYARKVKCYEELYNFDICDSASSEYKSFFSKKIQFDYILFSDVLEHLVNPATVLYQFGEILNENGKILISIPNIAHYDIVNGLLKGIFNYSDMGILDNTHLRFFTKSSFAEYIESANKKNNIKFDLEYIGKTIIKPQFLGQNKYLDEIIQNKEDLFILQNIFVCSKIKNDAAAKKLKELINEKQIDLNESINNKLETLENENNNLNEIVINQQKEIEDLKDIQNEQFEKIESLNYQLNNILNSKSWKSTQFIRELNARRLRKKSRTNKIDNKKSVLFFVHSWLNVNNKEMTNIGGTTLHLIDIINNIKNNINCYVVTVINNKYVLVTFDGDTQKIYNLNLKVSVKYFDKYDFNFMNLIFELIENLRIDLIHIHHFQNFPCDLQFLPKRIKTVVTIHDYFPICPKIQLINYNKKLCIDGIKSDCQKCNKYLNIDFETRETAFKNLLENAETVIAPDESVFKELENYMKIHNKKVIPHGILISKSGSSNRKKVLSNIKNIAFVGLISPHKGADIVRDLVEKNENVEIIYHLFGLSSDSYLNENHYNYICHGIYNQNELPNLLIENNIDLVIFPAIWPETFSYTLSETILANIPAVSYNLGAIANRIKKENLGWIINKKDDFKYTDFVNKYDTIFNENNYKKVIDNLKKFKSKTIEQMIQETKELYQMTETKEKVYDNINDYLEKYYLQYII